MSSLARRNFLENLEALRDAAQLREVQAPNKLGDFLRRGLTVSAFNSLEAFIDERWQELAAHMNGGQTQFIDLPERIQSRAIRQTLLVANAKIQRANGDIATLRGFSKVVGGSLAAVDRHLDISSFTWIWSGSNMSADDFHTGLKHIHVDRPWEQILGLTTRVGFAGRAPTGSAIDLRLDLLELAQERHKCAHVASYGVTSLWLRTVPSRILRFAFGFDCFASIGADRIRRGDTAFLQDEKWLVAGKVGIRYVKERSSDFAEFREGAQRARRTNKDGDTLFRESCSNAGELEAVVRLSRAGELTDWSFNGAG